jgi:hypothetical protein
MPNGGYRALGFGLADSSGCSSFSSSRDDGEPFTGVRVGELASAAFSPPWSSPFWTWAELECRT